MNNNPLFTPLLTKDTPLASQTLLEQAHRYFGFVPNLLATLAHSPSVVSFESAGRSSVNPGMAPSPDDCSISS